MPTLRRTLLAAALVMPAPSPVLALIDSVDLEPGGASTLSLTVVQSYDDVPSPGCLALPITLTLHEGPAIGVNVSSATHPFKNIAYPNADS